MFNQTNLTTVFCSADHVKGLKDNIKKGLYGQLKNIVIMDPENSKDGDLENDGGDYQVMQLAEVMVAEKKNLKEHATTTFNDIYTFSYTSGTTGDPKGAMMTHGNILTMVSAIADLVQVKGERRYCSYLPLAHVYERVVMNYMMVHRAKYGIFSGDVFKLS